MLCFFAFWVLVNRYSTRGMVYRTVLACLLGSFTAAVIVTVVYYLP